MKFFLPIIVIALLNLFHFVSSLPMDSSGSQLPPELDLSKVNPGNIVSANFLRSRGSIPAIFVGKTTSEYYIFLSIAPAGRSSIDIKTLDHQVSGLSNALRGIVHGRSRNQGYSTTGQDLRVMIPDELMTSVHEAPGVIPGTAGIIYNKETKVTRLEDELWGKLLKFVNAEIKPNAADVTNINDQRRVIGSWNGQPIGVVTFSGSASSSSQLRTPTLSKPARSHPYQARGPERNHASGSGSTVAVQQHPPESARAATGPYVPSGHPTPLHPYYSGQDPTGEVVLAPAPGAHPPAEGPTTHPNPQEVSTYVDELLRTWPEFDGGMKMWPEFDRGIFGPE